MTLVSSFPLFADHVREPREWLFARKELGARSWRGAARAYARKHGIAVAILADDSAACFALDHESGKVREWRNPAHLCEWVHRPR